MAADTTRNRDTSARRRDRDGSGPIVLDRPIGRFPGAAGGLQLFGEVLLTGLLVTLVGAAVVTLPIALAAGIRHVRRHAAAEDSRLALFWRDVRAGILPGSVVGLVAVIIAVVLLVDIDLGASGHLPGGPVFAIAGGIGLATLAVVLLSSAAIWSPETGWLRALREAPARIADDPIGAVYLAVAAGFVVLATWMLVPMFIPAVGCAVLAVVAVPARRRGERRRRS